jgi:hypothetical protein
MPIHFTNSDNEDFSIFGIGFKIRGENEKEFQFIKYMGKDILIYPVNKNASKINTNRRARLLKKYFLKNDVVIYLIEVFNEDKTNTIYLLKPKTRSITYINGIYPIGILMQYESSVTDHKNHETLSYKDLKKIEYVYIKDLPD